jgi:hypothetical protein
VDGQDEVKELEQTQVQPEWHAPVLRCFEAKDAEGFSGNGMGPSSEFVS